jgi:hypothetical protein
MVPVPGTVRFWVLISVTGCRVPVPVIFAGTLEVPTLTAPVQLVLHTVVSVALSYRACAWHSEITGAN